ncbi:hypothetical protein P3T76_004727 [Phytophthora citrophthora]|uniref:Microsomal glutathione S-transferase 1 n=1 Tax=Phytophthora citrophthora TaxID=4793 RepID=A0AAD9GRU6_9STRA|nr:hypothetical protein P3T76_004727 [Phytophthora citrophthora]
MVNGSVKVYVCCSSVLYMKFLTATLIQGSRKFVAGERPPEDSKFPTSKRKQTFGLDVTVETEILEASRRWGSIVMSDLESIPLGLFIFGAGIMAGANQNVHCRAMVAFTTARCLHTYAYAKAKQPMRSLCYGVGMMATLVGLGNAVSAIL